MQNSLSAPNQQPLLLPDVENLEPSPSKPPSSFYRPKLVCYTILSLFGLFVVGGLGFLFYNGAFHKIDDHDAGVVNGTVVEPNSHESFPIQLPTSLLGLPGPERLIGVTLAVSSMAHVNIKVTASAIYVDRTEARAHLQPFRKSGLPSAKTQPNEFAKFIAAMGLMTTRFELRMLIAVPGSQMQESWSKLLVEQWNQLGATAEEAKEMRQCFLGWFSNHPSTHKGDKYVVEHSAKTKSCRFQVNNKMVPGECKNALFGLGVFQLEFSSREKLAYLLPALWDTQYDKY
ncbi:hypothetical protein BASA81_007060 [Batrachochytrium salamandrivorans]|nr:hypothetical protein BASA81_007060 [Batrachochytrium salamandrivorans]